jgi:hypothetical protein
MVSGDRIPKSARRNISGQPAQRDLRQHARLPGKEVIRLQGRTVLRVKHLGYLITYASSIAEMAEHIDLADLVEVVLIRG